MEDLQKILSENKVVLIDFYADWCSPCRMLGPIIEEIKTEAKDYLKVVKINVDEQPELAAQYGVGSIPNLVVIKDGKVYKQAIGFRPKKDVLKLLD